MKKYIVQGNFIIKEETVDDYYEKNKNNIDNIVEWANELNLFLNFGYTDKNDFICQYEFTGDTKSYIKGLASELKFMLKSISKDTKLGMQIFRERIF